MNIKDLENRKKELEDSLISIDNLIMKKLEERSTCIQDTTIIKYQIIHEKRQTNDYK